MPRQLLDQELGTLFRDMLAMGALVDRAIFKAGEALVNRDMALAEEVVKDDTAVNEARWRLEEECYRLLATQQPMATDLRTVGSVLSTVTDIERIGDHAAGIARIVLRMTDRPALEAASLIPQMFQKCREDLRLALEAFYRRDERTARWVCAEDDQIDALYKRVFNELLLVMMRDPASIDQATYLVWVAHKLERIHDRVTNIGRRAVFMITGQMADLSA